MMNIENTTDGVIDPIFNITGGIAETTITGYDIFTSGIGILAVLLNVLLLIAMVRNRPTIFTSKGAYLIANLAAADLVTGLIASLWGLRNAFQLPQALTNAMYFIFWISIEASFLMIFIMSLERYIAIAFPFAAKVCLTKKRTIQSCVAVWIFSALCVAWMALSIIIVMFCLMVIFEITILVSIFFYYKIVIKLRQRRATLSSMQPTGARGTHGNAVLQRQYQLTTVVVAITFILVVTVLPYMVVGQFKILRHLFVAVDDDLKLQLFLNYYLPVELMNFVLNPIVYAWRLPNYRFALLRTFQFR